MELGSEHIAITLRSDLLLEKLGASSDHFLEPIVLRSPAVKVRRGHELRLVIPGPEQEQQAAVLRTVDDKLIALRAETLLKAELPLSWSEQRKVLGMA